MAANAREFLDYWFRQRGRAAARDGSQDAHDLIADCLVVARMQGLSRNDLEAEVGNLKTFIADEMAKISAERDRRKDEKFD